MVTNYELNTRRKAALPQGVAAMHSRYIHHAHNAEMFDVEANRLIDFATGIAVCNTGHCNQMITDAVKSQINQFSHTCFNVGPYESYIELAEKLNKLAPGDTPKKTFFVTTGAEAVENSIKIARSVTGRSGVIAFKGGFHGRTLLGLSLTGKTTPYKLGFGPYVNGIFHAPYPNDFLGISVKDSIQAIESIFQTQMPANNFAAIIIEPVQGEGGFYPAPKGFLKLLRALCDKYGILLICDEIQTGFARTGKIFATEYSSIEPDIITVAKAMAGGYPIAGVIGKASIMDSPQSGGLGGTYGGSPIGCVAALSVLEIIERDQLCSKALNIGKVIRHRLEQTSRRVSTIADVRGLGAMVAVEFFEPGKDIAHAALVTKRIVDEAANLGLILLTCGMHSNVIRFLPPLTIHPDILQEGLDIFETALKRIL